MWKEGLVLADKFQVMSDDCPGSTDGNYESLSQHRLSRGRDINRGHPRTHLTATFPRPITCMPAQRRVQLKGSRSLALRPALCRREVIRAIRTPPDGHIWKLSRAAAEGLEASENCSRYLSTSRNSSSWKCITIHHWINNKHTVWNYEMVSRLKITENKQAIK
jgi:hypothetical protein